MSERLYRIRRSRLIELCTLKTMARLTFSSEIERARNEPKITPPYSIYYLYIMLYIARNVVFYCLLVKANNRSL